jgi:hypothetical protein
MRCYLLFILFLFLTGTSFGDYKCYNYKGNIGTAPVWLSIQFAWSDSPSVHWEIRGNYQYLKSNNTLTLYGWFDSRSRKVRLFEYDIDFSKSSWGDINNIPDTNNANAILQFNFSEDKCNGSWYSFKSKKTLKLDLIIESKLDGSDTTKLIDIRQNFSTSSRYFIGEYAQNDAEYHEFRMANLKIYDKKAKSLLQKINFEKYEIRFGNVSTVIYNNIWYSEKGFWIWTDLGRSGSEVEYIWDYKTGKYRLSPDDKESLNDFLKKE